MHFPCACPCLLSRGAPHSTVFFVCHSRSAKEKGGNPNWLHPWEPKGRANQFTALHIAADSNHVDVAKWLGDKAGASLDVKAPYGETALDHTAGRHGMEAVHSYLKMKTAMNAVLAANRFKAMQANKKSRASKEGAGETAVAS